MNLFNIFKRNKPKTEERSCCSGYGEGLIFNSAGTYNTGRAMLLSAVYRCVDVISDAAAQLPIEPYMIDSDGYKVKLVDHPSYNVLNYEPNQKMSRFTFIKTLIVSTLLRGNGYAYIQRDNNGDVKALHYIDASKVVINEENDGSITYTIAQNNFNRKVSDKDIIHIINFTYDGVHGISTLQHAKNSLGLSSDSEAHAAGFFKGGANLAGILNVNSSLTENQKMKLKQSWQQAFGVNAGTPNGVAVLEGNMQYTPITVSPQDSQLLETRKFNVTDICRFFGVSPTKAFDLSNSSYSTVEAAQLAFLTDTLAPLLEKIELEMERKLFKPNERFKIDVRFDTSVLLRTDKVAESEYLNKMFYMGVFSINELRQKLDLAPIKDGDIHFLQSNMMTLENAKTITPKGDKQTTEKQTITQQD